MLMGRRWVRVGATQGLGGSRRECERPQMGWGLRKDCRPQSWAPRRQEERTGGLPAV